MTIKVLGTRPCFVTPENKEPLLSFIHLHIYLVSAVFLCTLLGKPIFQKLPISLFSDPDIHRGSSLQIEAQSLVDSERMRMQSVLQRGTGN